MNSLPSSYSLRNKKKYCYYPLFQGQKYCRIRLNCIKLGLKRIRKLKPFFRNKIHLRDVGGIFANYLELGYEKAAVDSV